MLDALDYMILERLKLNGRVTWSELAGILKLSPPSTAERVKKMEEEGVISGYTAIYNYEALGFSVMAFIAVTLEHPIHIEGFLAAIDQLPEIVECHHVTGEDDYLLKVRCRSNRHLDQFLNEKLKILKGVGKTRTMIALSSPKEGIHSEVS